MAIDQPAAVAALAALAQESRLSVFRLLVTAAPEGAFAGEIAERLGIPANTLSFHLKALAQAGLVSAEPHGRHVRYRADIAQMQRLVGYLTDTCCGGQPDLCAPVCEPASAARHAASRR